MFNSKEPATVSSYNLGTHQFPSHTWNTNLAGITIGAFIKDPFLPRLSWFWHRHTNRDTPSKAHWRLCSSNALIVRAQPTDQLSVRLQGCHRTTADLQHCHIWHIHLHPFPPHTSLGSLSSVPTPTRIPTTQVTTIASRCKYNSTQLTFHEQPHQPPGSPSSLRVQLLSLLHHSPTISHRCHWRGSTVVEHVI